MAVVKFIELAGTSPNNWHEAVANAVAQASKTIRNIRSVDIVHSSCEIEANKISQYKVEIRLGFEVESLRD